MAFSSTLMVSTCPLATPMLDLGVRFVTSLTLPARLRERPSSPSRAILLRPYPAGGAVVQIGVGAHAGMFNDPVALHADGNLLVGDVVHNQLGRVHIARLTMLSSPPSLTPPPLMTISPARSHSPA